MGENKNQSLLNPKINLDDFFTTSEQREDEKKEKIDNIDISLIDGFNNHPFKVSLNDELKSLEDSIKTNGVMEAVILRKKDDGRYEMISGHRRLLACKRLGLSSIPARIKDLNDDEATIYMVDSNLHREKLLPSEKAFAYKMKYEALKHQRKNTVNQLDTEVCQVGTVIRSDDILSKETDDSARTIHRYIRLTNLIPELLQMVDNSELDINPAIALTPAVELSYLKKDEQKDLCEIIECNDCTPSLAQAIKLKRLSEAGELNVDMMEEIMNEVKGNQIPKIKIDEDKLLNAIPKSIDRDNIEDFVIKACEHYTKFLKQREHDAR